MSGKRWLAFAGILGAAILLASCINFGPPTTAKAGTASSQRSRVVRFADVTGDGKDDVIVATNTSVVRLSTCGSGCFTHAEEVTTVGAPLDLAAADFDEDGIEDVAVVGDWGGTVYFGGAASAGRPTGLSASDAVEVGPFTFIDGRSVVFAGDFDSDGDADLVAGNTQLWDSVAGDGAGHFATPATGGLLPSRASYRGFAAGDVDGDGDPELVTSVVGLGLSTIVAEVSVAGAGAGFRYAEPSGSLGALTVGDLDGDGLEDVAVTASNQIRLLRSSGVGFTGFGAGGGVTSVQPAGVISDLVLGDVDTDGRVDLLVSESAQGLVSWWNGDGAGAFVTVNGVVRVDRHVAPSAGRMALGSPTGGRPDLLATTTETFATILILGNASKP